MTNDTDSESIAKVLAGDTEAYSAIVERYSSRVFALAMRITRDSADAQDVAQEAFVKAFSNLRRFRGKSNFSTWLYSIAYNSAISYARRKKREKNVGDTNLIPETAEIDADSALEAEFAILENVLAALPPQERAILFLFYKEDKSLKDIAQIMSISLSSAKVRLHRARAKAATIFTTLKQQAEL